MIIENDIARIVLWDKASRSPVLRAVIPDDFCDEIVSVCELKPQREQTALTRYE